MQDLPFDPSISAALTPQRIPSPQAAAGADPEAIKAAAVEFEAVFIAQMLRPMFDALDADTLGGGGAGERMFRPMLVDQYAKSLAERGGLGLADAVARELLALQAAQEGTAP